MSEDQLPQENQKPESTNPIPSSTNEFTPNNGGFHPINGGMGYNGMQQNLPNATIVLVLGILSIVGCCCYGILGIILGIIALVLAKTDIQKYALNASLYTETSFKNLKAGRVCAIIGLIISGIYLLVVIAIIIIYGAAGLNQDSMREILQNMK